MSVHSISFDLSSIPPLWRQRLLLLLVVACFVLPLAAAWLLIGHWRDVYKRQFRGFGTTIREGRFGADPNV